MTDLMDAAVEVEEPASSSSAAADVELTHVVLRPFVGLGVTRFIGEVVNASAWRMADTLVEGRRLRVFDRNDPTPVTDGEGRFFINDDALLAYIDGSTNSEEN